MEKQRVNDLRRYAKQYFEPCDNSDVFQVAKKAYAQGMIHGLIWQVDSFSLQFGILLAMCADLDTTLELIDKISIDD